MAEATNPIDFSQFVEKHGEGVLDHMNDPSPDSRVADERQTPNPPSSTVEEPLPSSSSDSESDPIPLDDATLKALGLEVSEEPSSENDGDHDGSESDTSPSVDLDSLSQYLGYDRDQLSLKDGKVHVKTKVDGKLADKSLAELVKGYQLEEHTTRKSMELAQQRTEWEAEVAQRKQVFEQQANLALRVLQGQEQEIQQRYSGIPWDTLRSENPAEYSALLADYTREISAARQQQTQIIQEVQQEQQNNHQKQQELLVQHRENEKQKMMEKLQWSEQTAPTNAQNLSRYLVSTLGYNDKELNSIFDHRFVVLADKARRFDEMQDRVAQIKGKKITPKHVVPIGSAPAVTSTGRKKIQNAKNRLAESGSVEDAANLFRQLPGILE